MRVLRRVAMHAAGWLVVLAGCSQHSTVYKPVDFSAARHEYRPADYPIVYQNWTRHAKLVQDVGTVIEAWATYKSWDFRQAYVAKYADVYDLPDHDRAALLNAQLEVSRSTLEFHVAVQTTTDRWNDLERKSSPWRVTLLDGTGLELGPTSIRVLKLPEIYESHFFPERTEFTRTYEISFARPTGGQPFPAHTGGRLTLRIASPMGRIDLIWIAKS